MDETTWGRPSAFCVLAVALLAALRVGTSVAADDPVAHTRAGDVRGQFVEPSHIGVFEGIPHAASAGRQAALTTAATLARRRSRSCVASLPLDLSRRVCAWVRLSTAG